MKFLLDQDVYALTARFLCAQGHDVLTAGQLGLSQADDAALLAEATRLGRILVSRDRDFGALVFVAGRGGAVIYLRMAPATVGGVHEELTRVLNAYSEAELARAFVVVEPGRHRLRRLPG